MTSPKSPAFQFYPADFMTDGAQIVMELNEVGAYMRLMCVCWLEGSIPTDVRMLAKLAGCDRAEMEHVWPAIEGCFEAHPQDDSQAIHPRLERERRKQANYAKKMSEAGKRGAKKRWKGPRNGPKTTPGRPPSGPEVG